MTHSPAASLHDVVARRRAAWHRHADERAMARAIATAPTAEQAHELTALAAHG
jgi:hypothetical protein